MRNIISILLILFCFSSFAQENAHGGAISFSVKRLVNKIEKNNIVQGRAVGRSARKPKQYVLYESLKAKANKQELISLTKHSSAVVSCYAFWAILDIPEVDILSLAIDHINDTNTFKFQNGCVVREKTVGDFYYGYAHLSYTDSTSLRFDSNKANKLDSLILYTPNNLKDAKNIVLYDIKPLQKHYERIRELAIEGNTPYSIIALAKYQDKDDISIILDRSKNDLYYIFLAISFFPDSAFYPFLVNCYDTLKGKNSIKYMLQSYYEALILYQSQKTIDVLMNSFAFDEERLKDNHLTELLLVLSKDLNDFYNQIYWKLWEEEKRINTPIFKHLRKVDSLKTFENSKYSLTHLDKRIDGWVGEYFDDELILEILDLIYNNDKQFYINISLKNIENIDPHMIYPFIKMIKKKKGEIFIEPMLNYLKNTAHIYQCKTFIEALILYDNDEIVKKMLSCIDQNSYFKQEKNEEEINALLKKYNIKRH